jgi:glycerol-3-phosphate dehydrogenase
MMSVNYDYDLIVVGGGIHGAGVAQAAATAGYSVLVLEKNTIASGTSSRSSKLIHGGLRYLETAQLSLVRECLRERALLVRLAPELVKLKLFYIPIYKNTSRRPWQLRIGLSAYSLLGGFAPDTWFFSIKKKHWDQLEGLEQQDLEAVFCYQDAQTDDAALTRSVFQSAITFGADVVQGTEYLHANIHPQHCEVTYSSNGQKCVSTSRVMVNAGGPWVNQILKQVTPSLALMDIELVQGTHIVVRGAARHGIYYIESITDKRAIFVMPWKGDTLVGTTESLYKGDPSQVKPLHDEIEYLKSALLHYFPQYRKECEIIETFSGLRVLPASMKSHFKRSRDIHFMVNDIRDPRVISIYGGKLTAYRLTAQQVMKRLQANLPKKPLLANTDEIALVPPVKEPN